MSLSGINSDIDDAPGAARPEPDPPSGTGRRWSLPAPPRLSLPVTGMLAYAGIRLVSVAIAALMLGHGNYRLRHWSLIRWMRSSDGGHYRAIAAHGYAYPPGQLAHASVFSWFPGYPAVIDSIAWLPGITIVAAGLIVTAAAGMAAAWGLTTLGLKLTGDPRISLLMVAIWAVAPSSTVLSMLYAEALFCALAVWALVALVSRRWLTAGRPAAGSAGAAGVPGVRGGGDAPAGRMVLGREAHHAHGVRLGGEHAARGQGHGARLALGGAGPRARGHRRGGAAHVLEPDRAHPRLPARLHDRGGHPDPHHQRQLDQFQAALPAPRRAAGPSCGPAAGPAADFGAGAAHRRAGRGDDVVRPLPGDHREVDALSHIRWPRPGAAALAWGAWCR